MKERYPFLDFVLKFFKVTAYIEIVFAFVWAAILLVNSFNRANQIPPILGIGGVVLIYLTVGAVVIGVIMHGIWTLAIVEFFRCVMDIERNTRLTENDKYVLTKV